MAYARRKDCNQNEITTALKKAGYFVYDTSKMGFGFPDILVVGKEGQVVLMEVKEPSGRMTTDEINFSAHYPGCYGIVKTADEAIFKMQQFEHTEATR